MVSLYIVIPCPAVSVVKNQLHLSLVLTVEYPIVDDGKKIEFDQIQMFL